ncbi:MAG TPA: CBS and ACT domain-containing protein [Anaerolineae bacterium]|nr:CBS and ACT domain-containing protein [Anaerolineae bacterium]
MLVKEVMTPHPVVIEPGMAVTSAQRLMEEEKIRHLPVVLEGKGLVGLITRDALNRALPSELSSLSVWEINYQLTRIKARDVMVKKVITVTEGVTVEEAARIMIDRKIGSLPVMRDGRLVGIVTDIDLLGALSNLMGWRQPGVRVTVQVPDQKGQLARVATAIAKEGGLLIGGGSYPASEPLQANIVFKVRNVSLDDLTALLEGMEDVRILDIRESHP